MVSCVFYVDVDRSQVVIAVIWIVSGKSCTCATTINSISSVKTSRSFTRECTHNGTGSLPEWARVNFGYNAFWTASHSHTTFEFSIWSTNIFFFFGCTVRSWDINSVRVLFLSVSIPMFSVLLETAEEKLRKPLTYAGRSITHRRQSGRDSQAIGGEILNFLARPDFTIVRSGNPCRGRVHYVPNIIVINRLFWFRGFGPRTAPYSTN